MNRVKNQRNATTHSFHPSSSNPVASRLRNQRRDLHLQFSRGDKTPLELFLAGVRSWAGGLQRPCARLIWKLRASSGQWLWTLAGAQPGKSVSAPFLAANAMMDSEKAVGIVFLLHGGQPGIV